MADVGTNTIVKINGSYLTQDKMKFNHGKTVNIYIVYEINKNFLICSYPILENLFFGIAKLTKNAVIDKHKYSEYGIGFDRNCVIFAANMSSFVHVDNEKNNILILGEDPTQVLHQVLDGTMLTAEKMYSINFTRNQKRFCLSFHYNGPVGYLLVNAVDIYKFKTKDSEIVANSIMLRKHVKSLFYW